MIKVATASGNFNTAGTWYTGTETDAGTANGATMISTRYTKAFTAPNTTNSCQGIVVAMYSLQTTLSSVTAQLQEYNGTSWSDCAGASMTLSESDITSYRFYSGSNAVALHIYFKFGTPYVYTTTSAGYYRVKFSRAVPSAVTSFYAGSTTNEVWGVIVDNRTGAPASSDTCYVVGVTGTKTTVTLDGACACGPAVTNDGTDYSAFWPSVSTNWAMSIGYMGQVIPDSTQNTTFTVNGSAPIVVAGGQLNFGTSGAPYNASYTASILFVPKTSISCGIRVYGYNASLEHFTMVGQTKTYKTMYASGSGTTGSPLVVDAATGWAVNDIVILSGDAYNKSEQKYIKTIAGTSITLSDSAGGAESGLANTHYTTDWVLNLTRNVSMGTGGSNRWWFGYINCTSTTAVCLKYSSYDHIGGNAGGRNSLNAASNARHAINAEGVSFYDMGNTTALYQSLFYAYDTAVADNTYKNNVHYVNSNSLALYPCVIALKNNSASLVTNNYFVGSRYGAVHLAGYGATYDNFHIRNSSTIYAEGSLYGSITVGNCANVVLQNSTVNGSRGHAANVYSGVFDFIFKNCSFGTVYANGSKGDFSLYVLGSFMTFLVDSCDLTSSGGWYYYILDSNGYEYTSSGSKISFQNFNNSSGDHRIYKPYGYIQRTAAGLSDTTVRTTGGSCLRLRSNNTTNRLEWSQYLPVGDVSAQTMTVGVWCKINSATYYAGTHQMPRITVDYDNGTSAYAEAAQTTDWQFLSLPITAATTYPEWVVTISAMTDAATTNADVYFTDFAVLYPAGYQLKLGELADFARGQPLNPTIATNLSPADVWAVNTSGHGIGTMGKKHVDNLTTNKFIALQ